MTIGEALKAGIGYPIQDASIELICRKRGLYMTEELADPSADAFRLAEADVKMFVVNFPSSVSEGGISISKGEVDNLRYEANAIYQALKEKEAVSMQPKVTWFQC